MIEIKQWVSELEKKLKNAFKERVLFIGYQGSYRRGEADENSDIDIVFVLDALKPGDLDIYKSIVRGMPEGEKACGFISGRGEIGNWSKFELFQLYNDTEPVYGDMAELIGPLSVEDAKMAVKVGAQNLYHAAVHSYMYNGNLAEVLPELYKGVFFMLQAEHFAKTGEYILKRRELLDKLSGIEREVLAVCIDRKKIRLYDTAEINRLTNLLIEFASERVKRS